MTGREAAMSAEARLRELGIDLPQPTAPAGNYVGAQRVGNLVYLSGEGPRRPDGHSSGKVGRDFTVEQARAEARLVGLNMLTTLRREIGSLDRVRQIVKVFGMVNAVAEFEHHPAVIDGFSDLMAEVFGDAGRSARSAVGMASLPFQIPVEIEMIVEIED
jgi:enamine deaminase RidA (YjgF/YER057c/UK114 family)